MVKLRILVPDATVNYVTNPAMRYDTSGWSVQGAAISRVLTRARFGMASLEVVTSGISLHEGAFFRVSSLSGVSEPITVSAYVRGTGLVRIRMDDNVVGGAEFSSTPIQLDDDRWHKISVSGFSTGGNDIRLFVETDEAVPAIRTFYVDGAQVERKSYATTYVDGDQEGCRWNGIYHASTSQRGDDTRAGGRWVQLAGEEREAEDLYMTVVGGLGAAPLTNNTQSFAQAPGGFFSNNKVNMRVTTLTFHAKHKVDDVEEPVSLEHLHELRQMLIDVVKPDLTGGDEDICFEYDDGNRPLYFKARYDGGLEGEWDVRNQFFNSFPLRLLGVSPFLDEDSQEAQELDFQNNLPGFFGAAMHKDGEWQDMNFGFNGSVTGIKVGPRGELIAAGNFSIANNDAAAIDPLRIVNGIAYWDGEKWNPYSTGMGTVGGQPDLGIGANGDVYVSGQFVSIGGVSAKRVAYWDGSTWNPMGTGIDGGGKDIRDILVAPNGDVYVAGSFTDAGGVTVAGIARWDGSSWHRVGQFGGVNNYIFDMAMNRDGSLLYIGGQFTSENGGGQTLNRVAVYDTSTGMFAPMDNGFNGDVYGLTISPAGILYACGAFTQNGDADTTLNYIAYWNGSVWLPLGTGMDALVASIQIADKELLYAQGSFTMAGGIPANKLAIWNGSTWVNVDYQYPAALNPVTTQGVAYDPITDILYLGSSAGVAGTPLCSGITHINNRGSAAVPPRIYLKGPGTLKWIENQSTQKNVYLNLDLLNGEEAVIDFSKGIAESVIRGTLFYAILPGSDFGAFVLRPGENKIACFMVDDVDAQMSIQFESRHWSADATGIGEGL